LVHNYLSNPSLLSGIGFGAADVDGNGVVNSADALLLLQRSIGIPSAVFNQFNPSRGNWISESPSVTVQGSHVVRDLEALSLGDVNGDFNLSGARTSSGVELVSGGTIRAQSESLRSIPIHIEKPVTLGSFQLFLRIPQGMEVEKVLLSTSGEPLVFHQQNGLLNIGWFARGTALTLMKGDELIRLELRSAFNAEEVLVEEVGNSLAYDDQMKQHPLLVLSVPRFVSATPTLSVQCYPNPFSDATRVAYELPEAGDVTIALTDLTGKGVRHRATNHAFPGRYSYELEAEGLQDGVYMIQFTFTPKSQGGLQRLHQKLLLNR
jgi:hypothetical protein